ncbi:MAG: hypothetical protein E7679_06790 [Ruminococcaceae bacterium]|nr:hypothetical protein [Oscillospiraceae bacterium]
MKHNICVSLLLGLMVIFSSCSLPHKIPSSGIWHNNELNIRFECKSQESNPTLITNIVWTSKNDEEIVLDVHLGYGAEIIFYYEDENENEICVLEGYFKYSNDQFVVTASRLATPFDISGTLCDVNDRIFIFTRE